MIRVIKSFGAGSIFLLLAACSSSAEPGSSGSSATDGVATNGGATNGGATNEIPPECAKLSTCSERCYCTIHDIQVCAEQYCSNNPGGMSGGGGSGDSTGAGSAGSGAGGNSSAGGGTGTGTAGSGGATGNSSGGSGNGSAGAVSTGGSATGTGGATTGTDDLPTFTINSAHFTVPAGQDVFQCQNFKNPLGKDVAILESESFMSAHSHHMFVFHGPSYDADSALTPCSGTEFNDFIHSAQTPQQAMTYPPGVGRILHGNEGLRVLVHYFNPTSAAIDGQVAVTFHYSTTDKVQYLAAQIFLNNVAVRVGPGKTDVTDSTTTPFDIKLLAGVSHMHSRGVGFTAKTPTQTLYQGTDWDEPKSNVFPNGLDIPAGTKITWDCTYNNSTGRTLTFGDSAATNEMCIFSGVFYTTDMAHQGVGINVQSLF